jgi:hypothetical protein
MGWKIYVRIPTKARIDVISHTERLGAHPDFILHQRFFYGAEVAGMEDTI